MSDDAVIDDPAAVLAALEKAKKEAKQFRQERDEARAALEQAQPLADKADGYKRQVLNTEVRLALRGEGVKDADRIAKYVDVSALDLDDDNNVTGLAEAVKQVKTDMPELFDAKRRVGGAADIFADTPANTIKSASEQQAALLLKV